MSLQQSYIALDWVKDALDETLHQVQQKLAEQSQAGFQAAYEGLHQVSGTLHMAQLNDVLMLSDALEKVLHEVIEGRLQYFAVQVAINQSLSLLVSELQHLQQTKSSRAVLMHGSVDLLGKLLPNAPKKDLVSFVPDLSLLGEQFVARPESATVLPKLTQAYQHLLGLWLVGDSSKPTLQGFVRVAGLLHDNAQTRQQAALWQIGTVFHQSMVRGYLIVARELRPLLIRMERSLTRQDGDHAHLNAQLIGDLLHILDPKQIPDAQIQQLRQLYGMELPEGLGASNRLLDSAHRQMLAARDGLVLSRDTATIALREAIRLLNVSGWSALAAEAQAELQKIIHGYRSDDNVIHTFTVELTALAEKVHQTIELTSLSSQVAEGNLVKDARHAAVRESRAAIEKIKSALAIYHQSRGDSATLALVPELLQMVSGAFTMLTLTRVAKLLANTSSAIQNTILLPDYVPHWKQVDLLAQLIAAIEYYLDQLAGHYQDDRILDAAELTLAEFKQPNPQAEPVAAGGAKLYHDETTLAVLEESHEAVHEIAAVADHDEEHIDPAFSVDELAVAIPSATETLAVPEAEVAEPIITNLNPFNDDFDQDEEIREIFIEEANEVLEHIAEYYPKWKANFADEASLKELRRGFHTLKGSGRMVGARTVGELAWSIESLLNRVMDRSIGATTMTTQLIDEVNAAIPELVESYTLKHNNTAAMLAHIQSWIARSDYMQHPSKAAAISETLPAAEEDTQHVDDEFVLEDIEAVASVDVPPAPVEPVITAAVTTPAPVQSARASALPLSLLSDKAPQELPADDFISYFGDDDTVREIFLEEVAEVQEHIAEQFPLWAVDFANVAALKEIRRSFHTLKGSGRMVGARSLGELAWSIARLLNAVLDKTIAANQSMVQLIGDVVAIVPKVVEDFAAQQAPRMHLLPIIHVAWLLHDGHALEQAQIQTAIQNAVDGQTAIESAPAESDADDHTILLEDFESLAASFSDEDEDEASSSAESAHAAPVADAASDEAFEALDPQLLEIFVAEVEGYLEDIQLFTAVAMAAQSDTVLVNDALLRALHTLRGSAGMTGIQSIYQLAHVMEHECKRLMREHQPANDDHLDALVELVKLTSAQVVLLKAGQVPKLNAAGHALIERVEAMAPKKLQDAEEQTTPVFTGLVTELMDLGIDDVLDAEWTLADHLAGPDALAHIETIDAQLAELAGAVTGVPIAPLTQLVACLYTSYQHIQVHPALLQATPERDAMVADLLAGHIGLTQMFDSLAASQEVQADQAVVERLQYWLTQTGPSVPPTPPASKTPTEPAKPTAVAAPQAVAVPAAGVAASVLSYPVDRSNDPELLDIFMEEAEELIQEIDASFSDWAAEPTQIEPLKSLQRQLHTLKGGARMACVESLGDYTHELETVYERLVEGRQQSSPVLVRFMRHAQDQVAQQVEQLAAEQTSFYTPTETEALKKFIKSSDISVLEDYFEALSPSKAVTAAEPVAAPVAAPVPEISTPAAVAAVSPAVSTTPIAAPVTPVVHDDDIAARPALGQMQVLAEAWDEGSAPDPEVLEIFLDEAADIIDQTSLQLAQWLTLASGDQKDTSATGKDLLKKLQRNLHTFKGGARMAGVDALGDLAHEMEFVYEDLALEKKPVTREVGLILNQSHDWLADAVAVLDRGERPQAPAQLIESLRLFRKDPALLAASLAAQAIAVPEVVQPTKAAVVKAAEPAIVERAVDAHLPDGLPPMEGSFAKRDTLDVASNEMVRVSANLMDKMINLAGENAINRARIEMELTGVAHIVDEMGTAIQRLSEQLRRMDGELESQIIARHQDAVNEAETQYEDFDPLEMDQYSSINQLSKSLAESVSDLLDFKNTLVDKARDSESLLLQQSRIQSELQEGLMSSRLVPFSRLVPRLQRVVRQTATELGKSVDLVLQNAEGELDRSVLERMIAPLEHMLRNAVDHGLEMPVDRGLQQKPEKGTITLAVQREGGEVIITLQDDGRGINVDAVQRKAVERGIIDAADKLTPNEVMQLIFHAGLSTAQQVTQISGRGVGMDVVQSEIRQLGGVVTVDSVIGVGTTFTLRLPLTVAVTDALRVRVGDRIFAVSLAQIERIVRVNPLELEQFYLSNEDLFNFEGKPYRLRYLGEMIGGFNAPTLYGQVLPLPLLIVKYEGQQVAIQVDQLVGSREEMVIKPVGLQLATVSSISGATILGDGSVVIILDLAALARMTVSHRFSQTVQPEVDAANEAQQKKVIMVVDDSVTVRKVTTRLLERHGYHVIQAKDGVDAMSKLEDFRPDLMLLDIEMPRMDGFEVATLVRHNPRLEELPIIMITSRTGEKHRERAYSIGVNGYMGKPFQEQILLENITELLAESSPA